MAKKNDKFFIKIDEATYRDQEDSKNNSLFLIVRSLKHEDGTHKGYNLELGDIIRLGRIEYRVIEFQDHKLQISSLLSDTPPTQCPFSLVKKRSGN